MFNMIKFGGEKNTQEKHSEAGDSQGSHCQISREMMREGLEPGQGWKEQRGDSRIGSF